MPKAFKNVLYHRYQTFSAFVCIRAQIEMMWHSSFPLEALFIGNQIEL